MPTRVAKYRRISDDREGLELGVGRQGEDLDAHATSRGYVSAGDYLDNDISASTRTRRVRPAYQRMLADARAGLFDVILAYTSSRLTRRPRELEDLIDLAIRQGVRFEYVRSPSFDLNTADGRQIARILAAADAAESERIGERVHRQYRHAAERGKPPRGHALGYTPDGLAFEEPARTAVRDAFEGVLVGLPLSGVAVKWNALGLRTVHGNGWSHKAVRDVLRNPRYAGLNRAGIPAEATWPALVDPEVWRGVQAILEDPARRTMKSNVKRGILSGFATCGICGTRMVSGGTRRGARSLKCGGGRHLERAAEPIEEYVTDAALIRLARPDLVDLLAPVVRDVAPLRARTAALRAQLDELAADLELPLGLVKVRDRALRERLAEADALLADASRASVLAEFVNCDPRPLWEEKDLSARRAIIAELMTVTVLSVGRGARGFREDSVRLGPPD